MAITRERFDKIAGDAKIASVDFITNQIKNSRTGVYAKWFLELKLLKV